MARAPIDAKLEKYFNKLGKIPDHEIAQLADVSRTAVVNFRKRQGIPPYEGHKFLPASAAPQATKITPAAVAAAPDRNRGAPAPTPVAVAAPPASAAAAPNEHRAPAEGVTPGTLAFSVAVDVGSVPHTYVVAASDIVEAARLAVGLVALRHGNGTVKGVQRVGELL